MTALSWRQVASEAGEILSDGGRVLARYDYSGDKNHPYFRDLRPLEHDGILTTTAPWDHRWHHGLWWSWKFINDVLYWEDHDQYGGIRDRGLGRAVVVSHRIDESDGAVAIAERVEWRENESGRLVLTESRSMTARVAEGDTRSWHIDWDHEWSAVEAAELDTTPYPENWWGGYAGLNYRASRSMVAGEHILSAGDRDGREAVHAEPAEWSALFGRVDGSGQDEPNEPALGGVAILGHPDNRGGPAPAYVFSAADEFGFLAAAPLMHGALTLAADETLRLRYRTVVFGREPAREELERLSAEFSTP